MQQEDYVINFYKERGRDFVILNLADVQFNDLFDLLGKRNFTVNTIKRLVEEVKPDLITLTGDQVWGFRTKLSLRFLCKLMDGFNIPWAPVLGNHDCLGTGTDVYRTIYGTPNFAFDAGPVHFLCLNTNAFEYDYSVPIPDFSFISADRDALPATTRRTVVAMHAQPFSEQFNNNVAELFQGELHKYPGLAFCLSGHGHTTQAVDLYGDGIYYYECTSAKGREYLLFTLSAQGMTYEAIPY